MDIQEYEELIDLMWSARLSEKTWDTKQILSMTESKFNILLDFIKYSGVDHSEYLKTIRQTLNSLEHLWVNMGRTASRLHKDRKKVADSKRGDYTRGDSDVFANFKNQSKALGLRPEQCLAVHMEKQFSAIVNYINTDGESESEPIIKRFGDTMNYLELLYGLIVENIVEKEKQSHPPLVFDSIEIDGEEFDVSDFTSKGIGDNTDRVDADEIAGFGATSICERCLDPVACEAEQECQEKAEYE